MKLTDKILISGCCNKRTIIAIIKVYDNDTSEYEKILLGKTNCIYGLHSLYICGDNIFAVDSYNGLIYSYNLEKKDFKQTVVGKDPRHIAKIDNNLYITNFESDNLSVIDCKKFFLSASIPMGIKPHDIIEEVETKRIYATCYEQNYILEYDTITGERSKFKIKGKPIHMDKYEDDLYVISYHLNGNIKSKLSIIDTCNKDTKELCEIKGFVTSIKFDKKYKTLYMINIEDRFLYSYDLSLKKPCKLSYLGGYPEDIDIGQESVYITNSKKKSLTKINRKTKELTAIIDLSFIPECIKVFN